MIPATNTLKIVATSPVAMDFSLRAKIQILARMGILGSFIATKSQKPAMDQLAAAISAEFIHPVIENLDDRRYCLAQVRFGFFYLFAHF